jgi:hypothetical protein
MTVEGMKYYSKMDIVKIIAKKENFTRQDVNQIITSFIDVVEEIIQDNIEVIRGAGDDTEPNKFYEIIGIAKFMKVYIKKLPRRRLYNNLKKEKYLTNESFVPIFKSTLLKRIRAYESIKKFHKYIKRDTMTRAANKNKQ